MPPLPSLAARRSSGPALPLALGLGLGAGVARAQDAPSTPSTALGPPLASGVAGTWAGYTLGAHAGLASPAFTAPVGAAAAAALDLGLRGASASPGAAARTLGLAGHGAWLGRQLGRTIVPFHVAGADRWPAVASAGLEAGGLAWAWRGPARLPLSPADWWLVGGATAAGHLGGDAAAAALGFDLQVGRPARAGMQTAGGLAAGGATLWAVGRGRDVDPLQPLVVGGQGAWVGVWLPRALGLPPTDDVVRASASGGAALGWTLGTLTEAGPGAPSEALSLVAWSVVGTSLARGPVDLLGGVEADQAATISMLVGGAGGSYLGSTLHRLPRSDAADGGAAMLMGGGQLFAAAQGGIWGVVVDESAVAETPESRARRRTGAGLLAYGLCSGATLAAPLWAEVDRGDALRAGSLSTWGAWLGGAGGLALGAPAGPHALATGVGAAAGAAAGLGLLRAPSRVERALIIDGVGLLGAGLGAATGGLAARTPRAAAGGALLGSAAGLGLGLQLSRAARLAAPKSGPAASGHPDENNAPETTLTHPSQPWVGPGIVPRVAHAARPWVASLQLSFAPWTPPSGGPTGAELRLRGRR